MNILITGANGLIGKNLIFELSKTHHIFCIDKKITNQIKNANLTYLKVNLLNTNQIIEHLKKYKINLAIHLAAFLGVRRSEKFELDCLNENINSTLSVLKICVKLRIKKIIFSSSSEVYGNLYKKPIMENNNLSPVSAYGVSKLCCETYIKAYAKKNEINYNILRFFNIYGKDQKKDFVIPKFAKLIKKNKIIPIYGNGSQIRSFCHVGDAVEAILRVIKFGKKNSIYNVGNNLEPINLVNLIKIFEKLIKKKVKKKFVSFENSDRSKSREIFFRIPNISKIKKDTGYTPKINLANGLKDFFK